MDELEIDGKKYLSSRRAAKEHKYHIDYIGQLIRGGKVAGKKVGRSWYVEASSLKSYLAQEGGGATEAVSSEKAEPAIEKVATPEPEIIIETPAPVVIHAPVIEKIVEPEIISKPVETEATRKVYFSTPEKEPVHEHTLTYVADDEPMLPVLNGRMRANADFIAVPMRRVQEEEVYDDTGEVSEGEEEAQQVPPASRKVRMPSTIAIITAASMVLLVAAASTALLGTSIKVREGQPASVGITVK